MPIYTGFSACRGAVLNKVGERGDETPAIDAVIILLTAKTRILERAEAYRRLNYLSVRIN